MKHSLPYELLENGNILRQYGVYDPKLSLRTLASVEVSVGDPKYAQLIPWLLKAQAERARTILATYRKKHPEAHSHGL